MVFNLKQHLAVLEIYGDDASTFLQGQLTNDIKNMDSSHSQISAHLNNKGRIFSNFIILSPESNHYYLILPKDMLDTILPRLKMFVLRSKVTINVSDKYPILQTNIENNTPYYKLSNRFITLNNDDNYSITDIEDYAWHKLLVDNNMPFIYQATTQQIIPQQINLDLMGAINFKKGCYTGQEIVARTHYLGKVKRRLVKFTSAAIPEIGQTITSPLIDNQEIGFIIDFYKEDSYYIGLASIQLSYIDKTQINGIDITCKTIGVEE